MREYAFMILWEYLIIFRYIYKYYFYTYPSYNLLILYIFITILAKNYISQLVGIFGYLQWIHQRFKFLISQLLNYQPKKKNISKIPLSFSLNTELMPSFYILFILSLLLGLTKYL